MKIADRLSNKKRPSGSGQQRKQPTVDSSTRDLDQILHQLHSQVVDRLDIVAVRKLDPHALQARVGSIIDELLGHHQLMLTPRQRQRVLSSILDEIVGLGPLEQLLSDNTVSDILVNGPYRIYVERHGLLEKTPVRFRDDAHLLNTINRIVARIGRRIDESSPMVDARLLDGSRVNAIIPPLALDGPVLSIRRFGTGAISPSDLIANHTLTEGMMQFLHCAVGSKCNILVSGGTGSGKTTLLNALSSFIHPEERIVTVEDAAELRLQQEHVVRLETRPPNIERKGEITVRDLVRNALRMRPDRIVVGEVRADEVLDMLQAMNTGHEGSMTTIHSNNASEAITRLMAMLSMASTKLSELMMARMISRSVHLVVHVNRYTDGRRRVAAISELGEIQGENVELFPVFEYAQYGMGERGQLQGEFRTSGRSRLLSRFKAAGMPLHPAILGRRS
jgi:pilus assembly protein CpaF